MDFLFVWILGDDSVEGFLAPGAVCEEVFYYGARSSFQAGVDALGGDLEVEARFLDDPSIECAVSVEASHVIAKEGCQQVFRHLVKFFLFSHGHDCFEDCGAFVGSSVSGLEFFHPTRCGLLLHQADIISRQIDFLNILLDAGLGLLSERNTVQWHY